MFLSNGYVDSTVTSQNEGPLVNPKLGQPPVGAWVSSKTSSFLQTHVVRLIVDIAINCTYQVTTMHKPVHCKITQSVIVTNLLSQSEGQHQ